MGSLEARYRNKLAPSKPAPKKKRAHAAGELVFPSASELPTVQSSTGQNKTARRRGRTKPPEPTSIAPGGCDQSPKPSPPTPTISLKGLIPNIEWVTINIQGLLTEMQLINVNIHPLRADVLERWRQALIVDLNKLNEVRQKWPYQS